MTSFTSVPCSDLDRLVPHRYAALFDHNITSQSEFQAWVITVLNKAGFKPAKINANSVCVIDMNSRYMSDPFQSLLVLLIQSSFLKKITNSYQSSKLSV